MEASTKFTTIADRIKEARDNFTAFSDALTLSRSKSTEAIAMKNEARAVANISMEKLAIVVNALAIDDPTVLYATNLPLVKERGTTPTPELQKPQGVVATNCQNSGDVKVTVKRCYWRRVFCVPVHA
ncbi:MAG: hypothetical protein ACR2KZ_21165 [Segetibacter sp.]